MNQQLKQIKKRADINTISKVDLSSCIQYAEKLITVFREAAKSAVSQISLVTGNNVYFKCINYIYIYCIYLSNCFKMLDDKKINTESIMQVMVNSVEKVFSKEESIKGVTVCLQMCSATLAGEIANAAQTIQEADLTLLTNDIHKVRLYLLRSCVCYSIMF